MSHNKKAVNAALTVTVNKNYCFSENRTFIFTAAARDEDWNFLSHSFCSDADLLIVL